MKATSTAMWLLSIVIVLASPLAGDASPAEASDTSPSPATDGARSDQRAELAGLGIAINLPPEWEWARAADADPAEWWDFGLVGDPAVYHQGFLAEGGILLSRLPGSPRDSCHLFDHTVLVEESTAYSDLADVLADYDALEGDPAVITTTTGHLDLATGHAAYGEIYWKDGWYTRDYVFTDGRAWFKLACGIESDPPDDEWLSIAETFEFLPAEE